MACNREEGGQIEKMAVFSRREEGGWRGFLKGLPLYVLYSMLGAVSREADEYIPLYVVYSGREKVAATTDIDT
jgi:hypothetical protein